MLKYIYSILLVCAAISYTQAQSVREDLQHLYHNFEGVDNIYFELEQRLVKEDEVGLDQAGKVYKQGGNYFYKIGDHGMLINKRCILIIDYKNKMIICNSWSKEQAQKLSEKQVPGIEDLLERYPVVRYDGSSNGYKQYTLENTEEALYQVQLYFSEASGMIEKTVYHYHPDLKAAGAELHLNLPVVQINPSFPKDIFSEKRFVREQKGALQPTAAFADFKVQDLRQPKR